MQLCAKEAKFIIFLLKLKQIEQSKLMKCKWINKKKFIKKKTNIINKMNQKMQLNKRSK